MKNEKTDEFIDVISSVRNSIHNNGRYVKESRLIKWNNLDFVFNKNRPISMAEYWLWLLPISRAISRIFIDIVNAEEIKKIAYYDDPTQST